MKVINANQFLQEGKGIVTLCGSTKFFTECMEVNRQLTFQNWIVLSCGQWGHSYHRHLPQLTVNHDVKKLHYKKMLLSHCIIVVSDDSKYFGDSTKDEIAFCKYMNIPVFYWCPSLDFTGETDVLPPNFNDIPMFEYDELINKWWENK